MPRLPLTDLAIRNLKAEKRQTYFDTTTPGFAVRVTPSGARTFVIVHGPENARKWEKIGSYPLISLARAREEARNRLSAIQLRLRPQTERMGFAEAYSLFLTSYKAKNRPKTVYEMERIVNRHLMPKFKRHAVGDITTQNLTAVIDRLLPTPVECAATFTAARTLFRWISRRRLIERSPLEAVPVPARAASRDRVLTDDELRAVWLACDPPTPFTQILKLLILTGQRKGQVVQLRGEWIDKREQTITWPASSMKNRKPHTVPYGPLSAAVVAALPESGLLFPARTKVTPFNGFSKSTAAFNRKIVGVGPWTLHDLRRTFSTGLARLRVSPHIKERLLAHASAQNPVEAIYDRHAYQEEMREAVQRWEAHLVALINH